MLPESARPVIATKLLPPKLRQETIRRERLLTALDEASRAPLTVLAAPAGFGKTTALRQWLAECGARGAWLSIDEGDNDPWRFASHLLAALGELAPGALDDAARALSGGSDLLETVLPRAVNGLTEADAGELVLVLDDYHAITAADCHALVRELIDRAPPELHFVVASRTPPPLRLARRRAQGTLAELGPELLRFRPAEAKRLLNELFELGLSADELAAIDAELQGWGAGLALVAAALIAGGGRTEVVDLLRSGSAHIHEYLIEEVLGRARPQMRDFLLTTSVLERLHPDLCRAVTGQPDAPALLAEARRTNGFVTALEDEAGWLRYNQLFADALRRQLEREAPERLAAAHARASIWFAERDMPDEAIEHAIAAGDGPLAASLLADRWVGLVAERRQATLRNWLDRLPPDRGELGPFCEGLEVLCMLHEGVDQRVTHERAEALAAAHYDAPGVALLVDVARVSPFYGNIARALEIGREAWVRYAEEPAARLQLLGPYAAVLLFAREHEELRALLEPRMTMDLPPLPKVWCRCMLGLLERETGDAGVALAYLREADEIVHAVGGETATEFAAMGWMLADVLLANGRLAEARAHADRGLDAERKRPGSIGHASALTVAAEVALAEGRRQLAGSQIRQARATIDRFPDVGYLADRVARVEAALASAPDDELFGTELTPAESRVMRRLARGASTAEAARDLYLSPNTVKSHIRRIYRRLGVSSRADAIRRARERGII